MGGTGAIGREAAARLCASGKFERIVVAGRTVEKCRRVIEELSEKLRDYDRAAGAGGFFAIMSDLYISSRVNPGGTAVSDKNKNTEERKR